MFLTHRHRQLVAVTRDRASHFAGLEMKRLRAVEVIRQVACAPRRARLHVRRAEAAADRFLAASTVQVPEKSGCVCAAVVSKSKERRKNYQHNAHQSPFM